MRAGELANNKRIECIRPVEIDHRFTRQDPLGCGMKSQPEHERMPIQEDQPIIRMKGNLRMAQCEKPFTAGLPSSAKECLLRLSFNKGQLGCFCCLHDGLHDAPRYPQHPPANACRCWQAIQQAWHSSTVECVNPSTHSIRCSTLIPQFALDVLESSFQCIDGPLQSYESVFRDCHI